MKKFFKLSFFATTLIIAAVSLNSCKKDFDSPPGYVDPNLVANTTIKALKAKHTFSGALDSVATDIIISGIVTANDKSGNLYKELYIQDETGAIPIELDATNIYTSFPVGRRVYIKCKGLWLSDYHGMTQLGGIDRSIPGSPALNGIPSTLMSNYVIGGSFNNTVPVTVITNYSALNSTAGNASAVLQDSLLGRLIRLDNFEFGHCDVNNIYADTSAYKNSINLTITDCSGNSVFVRTSGYANFAALHPAAGNGSIYGVFTIYKTSATSTFAPDKQLLIRDTTDVQFNGPRCSAFEEDFNCTGGANSTTLVVDGWQNIAEAGSTFFQNAVFGSTKCAKVSSFGSSAPVTTSWLITPAISVPSGTPKLTFRTSAGFPSTPTPTFKVYISTTYTGTGTPSTSFTTQLPAAIAVPVTGFSPFLSSGLINLSAYAGQTVYIGFRYDGSPTATATYEIDDIKVLR